MKVEKATSKQKANFPYVVQVMNTENWNTVDAYPDDSQGKAQAWAHAEGLANKFPGLRVRVLHYKGGRITPNESAKVLGAGHSDKQ